MTANAEVTYRTNIAACADNESSRYALNAVAICESGIAVATDGRCMAIAEIDVQGSIEQPPVEAADGKVLQEERKRWAVVPSRIVKKPTAKKGERLSMNGRVECLGNNKVADYAEGRYPAIGSSIPSLEVIGDLEATGEACIVSLDVNLLAAIAESICGKTYPTMVTLIIPTDGDMSNGNAILVLPQEPNGHNVGVLMPCNDDQGRRGKEATFTRSKIFANAKDSIAKCLDKLPPELVSSEKE
jgi:hypothetical protein